MSDIQFSKYFKFEEEIVDNGNIICYYTCDDKSFLKKFWPKSNFDNDIVGATLCVEYYPENNIYVTSISPTKREDENTLTDIDYSNIEISEDVLHYLLSLAKIHRLKVLLYNSLACLSDNLQYKLLDDPEFIKVCSNKLNMTTEEFYEILHE